MKVILIVKGNSITRVLEEVGKRLPNAEVLDSDHRLRLGAYRVDIDVASIMVVEVYQWFNDCPRTGTFPDGTLLWFQVTP